MVRSADVQTFQIREASPEDIPRIMMINRICLPENYTFFFFESILRSYPKSFLIAEVNGEIAGYIMCRVEWTLSKFEKLGFKKVGHIISIAILPEYRRRGLAKLLLENALRVLKEEYGCEEAYLEVRVSNSAAISLYEKCNFTTMKVSKGYYLDGEDAYIMARKL
ncbi:MAG: ribosomal protein S18-alanine N-acetyltransferase [Nitrososphaeria archaeon]|nr:ribosomal protein S18-alanine N-acetyltransferase [Aigarchaeota archaeon]MCX8187587.1 ribosomal protein S18-alanine N-acetyltransferase [Nitrososphaeria archaeon]MDW8021279.1 ribosomal protein S18-alanine N-acetyltransferase [Nitrososphaerota archaeon]